MLSQAYEKWLENGSFLTITLTFGFTLLLYNVIVKYECRVGSRAQEHFNLKFPVKLFLTMAPIAE